jgi:hypothetical protein
VYDRSHLPKAVCRFREPNVSKGSRLAWHTDDNVPTRERHALAAAGIDKASEPVLLGRTMRRRRALEPARAVSVLLLAISACEVDDRHLSLGHGGTAGTANGGGDEAGEGSGPSTGGTSSGGLVDGCADLDTDGVADCTTTLVENPTFASNVSHWIVGSDSALSWDPKNALEDVPSGSARLNVTFTRASASQCVVVQGKQLVIAYASAFVEPPEGDGDLGQAELEVSFFESDDCSGVRSGYFETPPSGVVDSWTTIQAGGLSAEETGSVSIALVGFKSGDALGLDVYFDNLMLEAKDP